MTTATASIPHSGLPAPRTGPELSDIALFGVAALAIIIVRRALRKRFARRRETRKD